MQYSLICIIIVKLFSAIKLNNFNLKHKTCISTSYINSVKIVCNLPLESVTRY